MTDALSAKAAQQAWARDRGIPVDDDGYVLNVEDNFVVPMSAPTRADFTVGSGNELGDAETRGKMQALHSSSALAYNVFEYWRQREDRTVLERALGLEHPIDSIRFEGKFSTGVGGPAHLDAVLEAGGTLVAIESKFLEPVWSSNPYARFSARYFPPERPRWTEVGLPGCQRLAEQVYAGELEFVRLDVPQLLKHALGLARLDREPVLLWYLFVELDGNVGERHLAELDRFEDTLGEELGFTALSYNELIARLNQEGGGAHGPYVQYLASRYSDGV